jgi:hypothetical protein
MNGKYYSLHEAYLGVYEENEERRSALAKADKNYRAPYERGNRIRAKVNKLINSDNPEDVKRGDKIHAANAQGSKKAIARSARNIQRGPGPRMAKADAERDMRDSGFKEEMDVYDLVLEYLIDGGFVDSEDAARNIMSVMSEDWKHSILLDWQMKQVTPKQRERYAVALRNLADTQEKIRNEKPQASQEEKRKRTTNLANVRLR